MKLKEARELALDIIEGQGKLTGTVWEAEDCFFFDWCKTDGTKDASSGPILVDKDLGEVWIIAANTTEAELQGSKKIQS